MPHVTIKTYPIPEEQKVKLAAEIEELIVRITGKPQGFVSIAITDVEENEWMEKVYATEILPNMNSLYKKPGY